MDKNAIVTHPVSMFLVAVVIGMVLGILIANGTISAGMGEQGIFCNTVSAR